MNFNTTDIHNHTHTLHQFITITDNNKLDKIDAYENRDR